MFLLDKHRCMKRVNRESLPARWRGAIVVLVMAIAVLACGGTASEVMQEGPMDPVNQSISGLPQFVAPSSTPIPTHTQVATDVAPPGGM